MIYGKGTNKKKEEEIEFASERKKIFPHKILLILEIEVTLLRKIGCPDMLLRSKYHPFKADPVSGG